jgi:hypothetical protein
MFILLLLDWAGQVGESVEHSEGKVWGEFFWLF